MNKLLILLSILCNVGGLRGQPVSGQTPRADTVLLAVYNMSAKYRLQPLNYQSALLDSHRLLAPMIYAQDTTMVKIQLGTDSLGRNLYKWQTIHHCDRITSNVKDQVVLIPLRDCDASIVALTAQRLGAKGVVFIHQANHRDSLQVTPGIFIDSISIPCYVVRRDIGKRISGLLPSYVGIMKPDTIPDEVQSLYHKPDNQDISNVKNISENIPFIITPDTLDNSGKKSKIQSVRITPNPANDVVYIDYFFTIQGQVVLTVKNILGQTVYAERVSDTKSGIMELPTYLWNNGLYLFYIQQNSKNIKTEKIIIQH